MLLKFLKTALWLEVLQDDAEYDGPLTQSPPDRKRVEV